MNGDSRIVVLDKPSSGTLRPHSALRPIGSGCAFPTMSTPPARHSFIGLAGPLCLSGFGHSALVWRDGGTLDDPSGRRPVPAPASAYAGSGRLRW
jgi:hypothetical protein